MKRYIIRIDCNAGVDYVCNQFDELDDAMEYADCLYPEKSFLRRIIIYREVGHSVSIPCLKGWRESTYKPIILRCGSSWRREAFESWDNVPYLYKREHEGIEPTFCYSSAFDDIL